MAGLLRGALPLAVYCALLRNLEAVYDALEAGLARHAGHPALAPLALPGLARTAALRSDLAALHGPGWREDLALAPAAGDYAEHLRALADARPELLCAHAYVRYLGDLGGGRILGGVVARSYALDECDAGTAFYRYADDTGQLARRFRDGLDAAGHSAALMDDIVAEARGGFERHVRLFEELVRPD